MFSAVADVIDTASGKTRFVAASFYGAWEYLPQDPAKPKKKQAIYSASNSHRGFRSGSCQAFANSTSRRMSPVMNCLAVSKWAFVIAVVVTVA